MTTLTVGLSKAQMEGDYGELHRYNFTFQRKIQTGIVSASRFMEEMVWFARELER